MTRSILVALVLLTPALPAFASHTAVLQIVVEGRSVAAPNTVDLSFGSREMGDITDKLLVFCFRRSTSPPDVCDLGGRVTQKEALARPFFVRGVFRQAGAAVTPATFPVDLQPGQRLLVFSQWVTQRAGAVADDLVIRTIPAGGTASQEVTFRHRGNGALPAPCVQTSSEVCLNEDRFKVAASFRTPAAEGGGARTEELTGDTGFLWFFQPSNVEAMVKVLDGCAVNNRFWVFAGGLTNVLTVITVTDTQRPAVATYSNPQSTPFRPIQDTSAFATCP